MVPDGGSMGLPTDHEEYAVNPDSSSHTFVMNLDVAHSMPYEDLANQILQLDPVHQSPEIQVDYFDLRLSTMDAGIPEILPLITPPAVDDMTAAMVATLTLPDIAISSLFDNSSDLL